MKKRHPLITLMYVIAIVGIIAAFMVGCAQVNDPDVIEHYETRAKESTRHYPPNNSTYDWEMEDGTRCIYIKDGNGSGLSCNFAEKENDYQ